jgi:exodeoxyribonuclease V gamma subunit
LTSGFTVHTGNRMLFLVEELAKLLDEHPLPSPFDPETIVVQSRDMERWLEKELAVRLGVFANARFPFPNAIVDELFRRVLSDVPAEDPLSRERMTWRLFGLLPDVGSLPEGEGIAGYLSDDPEGRKRIQLAEKIAVVLDRAILYRPKMVLSWEKEGGAKEGWLPGLWRRLAAGDGKHHRAALQHRFLERVGGKIPAPAGLPARICVFGIPAMPAFHFDVLAAVSRFVDVHLFCLNPSKEYWGDIYSHREEIRERRRAGEDLDPKHDLFIDTGNALLASLGRQGRDFHRMIVSATEGDCVDRFETPEGDTLLARIQSDIFHLVNRGAEAKDENERLPLSLDDDSIRVHCCHSRMREMEVLKDRLIDLFAKDASLSPGDIAVMAPDIDAYAPFIEAVFGHDREDDSKGPPAIPFSVANRGPVARSPFLRAFLDILALRGSWFTASEVVALCGSDPVRHRFEFSAQDVDLISRWVGEAGIRWGIDGEDRGKMGFQPFGDFSWKEGLSRLLLSVAVAPEDAEPFRRILPCTRVESEDPMLIGRFVDFAETLFARVRGLDAPRTVREWADTLSGLSDVLLQPEEEDGNALRLRKELEEMARLAESSGVTGPVPFDPVRHWIAGRLEAAGAVRDSRFLAGAVTFCKLLPMRSIPFRVIALAGMNGGDFPRQERAPDFDPVARKPRPGDRSLRDEDRYLFLESILSAGERLIITYVGRSMQSDDPIPPSVVVSELLDYGEQGFLPPRGFEAEKEETKEGTTVKDWLVVDHPLQSFSPRAFECGKTVPARGPFSYSREYREAAEKLAGSGKAEPVPPAEGGRFVAFPLRLEEPEEGIVHVNIPALIRFLRHPVKYFLQERLGISLPVDSPPLSDEEPFSLDGLQSYTARKLLVGRRLLEKSLERKECLEEETLILRAMGGLPPGHFGEEEARELSRDSTRFADALRPHMGEELPALRVRLDIEPFRVTGQLTGIRRNALLRWRPSGTKPKDLLSIWVEHLALLCLRSHGLPPEYPAVSLHVGYDAKKQKVEEKPFGPVGDPVAVLRDLLDLYRDGSREPLPFFERTSFAFAEAKTKNRSKAPDKAVQNPLEAAQKKWETAEFATSPGEGEDPWNRLAFGKVHPSPLDDRFRTIAERVYVPILESMSGTPSEEGVE